MDDITAEAVERGSGALNGNSIAAPVPVTSPHGLVAGTHAPSTATSQVSGSSGRSSDPSAHVIAMDPAGGNEDVTTPATAGILASSAPLGEGVVDPEDVPVQAGLMSSSASVNQANDTSSSGSRVWLRIAVPLVLLCCCAVVAGVMVQHRDTNNTASESKTVRDPVVILVSLDGFRWDYLGNRHTPNLNRVVKRGVQAVSQKPVFPSKTFPNHYSIVTGLFAESHGIIGNTMFDPVFDATYHITTAAARDGRWYGGEPIWVTAVKQGLKSACMFWPGSEAEIKGTRPTYYRRFDSSISFNNRVDQVLAWLQLPAAERPSVLTLYFDSPDHEGHQFGPASAEVYHAVQRVDSSIGHLLDGLTQLGLADDVHLIVTADHGMTDVQPQRTVFLEDYLDVSQVDVITESPVLGINPRAPLNASFVVQALQGKHPDLHVWLKEDVPERFKYRNNRRVPAVVGLANLGWTIAKQRAGNTWWGYGMHGYDNEEANMHSIFLASGPSLKQDYQFFEMQNVDVYELMCSVLGLEPAPNNGTLSRVQHLFR